MSPRSHYDIESVRAAVDIAQIIGEHVSLAKAGAQLRGLCPFHAERTPSFFVYPQKQFFNCYGCGKKGDVFGFLMEQSGRSFVDVLRDLAERSGIEPEVTTDAAPSPRPRPTPPAPSRPPAGEPEQVWSAARSVYDDREANEWLSARGLDVAKIVDRDLARAITSNAKLPEWCRFQALSWSRSGHRLIVRMWNANGVCESLHARSLHVDAMPSEKAAAPAGASCSGLVMACGLAVQVLAGKPLEWWPRPWEVLVAEGEPDWLSWATRWGDADEYAPAVLGVISGSWSQDIADRIPVNSKVIIRTHADEAGVRYADAIVETLTGGCEVFRREVPQ